MKIEFKDKSHVECNRSSHPGKIIITISAKDYENPLKKVANTVELTDEEFKRLISEVL